MNEEVMMMAGCMLRSFRRDERGLSNIIVVALGLVIVVIITSNVILWGYEMNQLDWEKMRENIAIASVERVGDVWHYNASSYTLLGFTSWVSGSVPDLASDDGVYMTFRSYNSGTDTSDSVDNNTSDVDSSADKGTHSSFLAQQVGPDSITDTLSETNTASGSQWVSPTGYEDPGDEWSSETGAYDDNIGTRAVDDVPGGDTWSQYLVLNHSSLTCSRIQYYIGRESTIINQVEIDIYNSTWTSVYSGTGVWGSWANISFTATSLTKMRFRFFNDHSSQPRMVYVYEADFLEGVASNYELDLEVQWTSVDYDETNEELCIYTGAMGIEDLRVDYWTGSEWSNLLTDLTANDWNNVSISLASATFTIRFKGGSETGDSFQDNWDIDVALLHAWSIGYASAVEFTGSSNMENWSQLNWNIDSAWTTGSVSVTLQLYNYTLDGYPASGNGYITYSSDSTSNTDETGRQIINVNPTHFRNATGYWKMKIIGVKTTDTQFDCRVDRIEFEVMKATGTTFTFKNQGPLTCHLVSLWVTNSTVHENQEISIYVNSGDTLLYSRMDIILPNGPHTVKVVTERGNIAVYSRS
ncbi:MAG: hypothetical protein JSV85_05295 [Candidatus Bathyarchaeota archaeon]|nr:MAG: hypothetical protein JSV85_05295 [Candidatus Bathyarchaeota archaeon]